VLYLVLGSEGQATITETYTLPARRGREIPVIEYTFKESDDFQRQGKTNLGAGESRPPVGEQIVIQYLPRWFPAGPDGARPTRPFGTLRFSLLGVMTVVGGFLVYRAIAASGPEPPAKRSRKR
jgi:hypothetical protein